MSSGSWERLGAAKSGLQRKLVCALRFWGGAQGGCAPARERRISPLVKRFSTLAFGQELGHGFGLGADEMAGKVQGQERIALGAGDGSLGVLVVFVLCTRESDKRGGKFHLCVRAAQSERLFHQGVAVDTCGWIGIHSHAISHVRQVLSEPLFVSFGEVAGVKPGQRVGVAGGFRRSRASVKPSQKFFRCEWVLARIESGAAKRFHSNEDGSVRPENIQRVADEVFRVVIFTTAEVPVVADPGQGLGLANFNGVANQGRTCQRDVCETQYSRHQNDGEPRGTDRLECHGFSNLLSNYCELQETRRSKIASC